ncbi:hypothetical protein EJB05_26929, partial [Eragrostis curvula]
MERSTRIPLDLKCLMSSSTPSSGWPERFRAYLPCPNELRKEMMTVVYLPVSQASRRVPSVLFQPQNTAMLPILSSAAAASPAIVRKRRARKLWRDGIVGGHYGSLQRVRRLYPQGCKTEGHFQAAGVVLGQTYVKMTFLLEKRLPYYWRVVDVVADATDVMAGEVELVLAVAKGDEEGDDDGGVRAGVAGLAQGSFVLVAAPVDGNVAAVGGKPGCQLQGEKSQKQEACRTAPKRHRGDIHGLVVT